MNSESGLPTPGASWERLLRNREFERAFGSAMAIVEDNHRGSRSGQAHITAGRIYLEFSQYQKAAKFLNRGIHMMPEEWHLTEEGQWIDACAARAAYKAFGSRHISKYLTGEAKQWFFYTVGVDSVDDRSCHPPEYDPLSSWELRIAGCRAHRRACRLEPLNTTIRERANTYGTRLWEDGRVANNLYDRILGIASIRCEAHFQYAALLFDLNQFSKAQKEFHDLLEVEGEHHVAALIARVQTARALGLNSQHRIKLISEATNELKDKGFTHKFASTAKADTDLRYEMDLARLFRQQALVEALTHADKAHDFCLIADDHAKRHSENLGDSDNPSTHCPGIKSFDLARYSISVASKDDAMNEGADLLRSVQLNSLATLFLSEEGLKDVSASIKAAKGAIADVLSRPQRGSGVVSPAERRGALTVAADILRAVGRTKEAMAWYETIVRYSPNSFSTKARILSLLLYLRDSEKALKKAREYSTQQETSDEGEVSDYARLEPEVYKTPGPASIEVEYAQALLVTGELKKARHKFSQLCDSEHHEIQIDAWCGLVDCARRSRDLATALELGKVARQEPKIQQTGRSHIEIALAWAEVQLGNPRRGLALALTATKHVRYSISGWIVCVRALRMLGRHLEAIELVRRLLGYPPSDSDNRQNDLDWLPSNPPNWSVRHEGLLRNELGWCHHDLDQSQKAASTFLEAVAVAPHLTAAHRGLIASTDPLDLKSFVTRVETSVQVLSEQVGRQSSAVRDLRLEAWRTLAICHHDKQVTERNAVGAKYIDQVRDGLDGQAADKQARVGLAIADLFIDLGLLDDAERELQTLQHHRKTSDEFAQVMKTTEALEILQGRIYLAQGNTLKARHLFDRAVKKTPLPSEALWVAKIIATFEDREFDDALQQIGEWEAADDMTDVAAYIPTSDVRKSLRAWVYLSKSELPGPPANRKEFLLAAKEELENSDRSSTGELHIGAVLEAREGYQVDADGRGYIKNYQCLRDAIGQLDEALNRRTSNPALLRDQAAIYMAVGKLDLAEKALFEAEARARKLPPRVELGALRKLDPQKYGRPRELLRDARIHLLKGWLWYLKQDVRKAVFEFEQAVAVDPNDYVHHRALALARLELGETKAASVGIRKGLNLVHNRRRLQLQLLGSRILVKQIDGTETHEATTSRGFLNSIQPNKEQPHRALLLNEARHLERLQEREYQPELSNWETAELIAHQALLNFKAQQFLTGRRLLKQAFSLSEDAPSVRHVSDRCSFWSAIWRDPKVVTFSIVGISAILAVFLSLYTFFGLGRDGESVDGLFTVSVLTLVLAMFLIGVLLPRLTLISLGPSFSMELDSSQPVEELVHADLDLPTNRLLQISGFSNHRPTIPFDDVETRLLDPPE